jgi:nucleotide-binding universal stress UspA family protein
MTSTATAPVVAGVDFTPAGDLAAGYAAWEARRRGRPVELIHGFLAPGDGPAPGPVLVGVGGPRSAPAVLGFGFEQAASRDVPLVAVQVCTGPDGVAGQRPRSVGPVVHRLPGPLGSESVLQTVLPEWQAKYPEVTVESRIVHGAQPAHRLLEVCAEAGAQLMVIGSRGHGGFGGLLLGSVTYAVLGHATTAVAVIRPGREH